MRTSLTVRVREHRADSHNSSSAPICLHSGSQVMASYMALREGWTDKDGNVEPVQFEGARLPIHPSEHKLIACDTVLDTFKNLRDGVNDGKAAAFVSLASASPANARA